MKKHLSIAICLFLAFGLWTALVCLVDIQPIGPAESTVGLATLNGWFHNLTGVHMFLYDLTDMLSLIPFGFVFGFAVLGLTQWIKRKKLSAVDSDILLLGGFYVATGLAYLFFEIFAVNFRPVLIKGVLEASYPSSTTLLIICIMSTAIIQMYYRVQNKSIRNTVIVAMTVFSAFMVIGRAVCGVHWLSDIIGGALLSMGLVMTYRSFIHFK